MPPILREFHKTYPGVHLDIHFQDSDQAYVDLLNGDIEFAIITLPSALPEGLVKQVVWEDILYPVCPENPVFLASWDDIDIFGPVDVPLCASHSGHRNAPSAQTCF